MSYRDFLELTVEEQKAQSESEKRSQAILIDGRRVVDERIRRLEGAGAGELHGLELRLGASALWFELQECGQNVSNQGLLAFVREDLAAFPEQATEAYLELAQRYMYRPRTEAQKLRADFQAYTAELWEDLTGRRKDPHHYLWECESLTAEGRTEDVIIFKGTCFRVPGR